MSDSNLSALQQALAVLAEAKDAILAEANRLHAENEDDAKIITEANERIKARLVSLNKLAEDAKPLGINVKGGEGKSTRKCSNCAQQGHDLRNCTQELPKPAMVA